MICAPVDATVSGSIALTVAAVPTGNKGGHQDVPVETVTVVEVTVDD